jgi:AsmA-like C-terminal region/AsmA family
VSFLGTKRGWLVVCAGLLLALFLVRPGATRLKARIAGSIAMALQRQVEIGSVHVRLLPQPGFDLENFVVQDDPAFGAEPVLRAQEVTAFLRLSSLLRGRLEISRLSLSEPSLNLTRNAVGRWNIENLLERTAKTAVAPTRKARSESRPGFPYIEADRGRINFKFGPEKKPFALLDASYTLWQDSENAWGMRLRARPMRTDFNLSDTGQFKVSGTWQRAETLRETPVQFNLSWDDAQLGQLTKLLSGQDKGWRGSLRVSAGLTGTPADLVIDGDGALEDFRRYDISGAALFELRGHCDAHYSTVERGFHQVLCQTPMGDGSIGLRGEAVNLLGARSYDLRVSAAKVPADALLELVRHAKKDLPADLMASGLVKADFRVRGGGAEPVIYTGAGQTSNLVLQSATAKTQLVLNVVPFSLLSGAAERPLKTKRYRYKSEARKAPDEPRLIFGPFPLKLGRPLPAMVQGWIARSGYNILVDGEVEVQRLLQIARTVGLPATHPIVEGWANVALQVGGHWSGFAAPKTTGSAKLHMVQAEIRGLNAPLEITSANLSLNPDATKVDGIAASVAGTRWMGSLALPRMCGSVESCPLTFDLHVDEISSDKFNQLLKPNPPQRPWYRFLSSGSQAGPSLLGRIRAGGRLAVDRVLIRNLAATRVAANVELDQGQLRLSNLRGEVMNGKHRGEWQADFRAKPPAYSGTGTLEGVSLGQLAAAMGDPWISGTTSAKYQVSMAGLSLGELAGSASGSLQINMRDGALPHITLAGDPLKVKRFTALLALQDGEIALRDGVLNSPAASFTVNGTASLKGKLDFKLVPEGSPGFSISGPLLEPSVTVAHSPETRAALKP